MGYYSELAIEIAEIDEIESTEERALDFDERNYTDGAWWAEQDAEKREVEQAERDLNIEQQCELLGYRLEGAMA